MKPPFIILIALGLLLLSPDPAHAYIGPGGGISALGALLALIAAVALAFLGFLWYPIKRLLRKRRESAAARAEAEVKSDVR